MPLLSDNKCSLITIFDYYVGALMILYEFINKIEMVNRMRVGSLVIGFVLFFIYIIPILASSYNLVAYSVIMEDVFPNRTDIDISLSLNCLVSFICTDGKITPNGTTYYSMNASFQSGLLNLTYNIDRPLIKRSGSRVINIEPTWLLGDSPPITVYEDGTVTITVIFHGHLIANLTAFGNASVIPTAHEWLTWGTKNFTVIANPEAKAGETIQLEAKTRYVLYFTVSVEIVGVELITKDSPIKEVYGTPNVVSSIEVVPEYSVIELLIVILMALTLIIIARKNKIF